jgi:hypothetical protein
MGEFEETIQAAVEAQDIPGCVLLSANRDGTTPSPLNNHQLTILRKLQLQQNLWYRLYEA